MCGICGIAGLHGAPPPDARLLWRMVDSLAHRGPDGCGGYLDGRAALGQSRLAIIDLAGGDQPMCNEDGTLWLVFNGEIYNYVELGQELRGLGHRFRTRSDSEVILHAHEQWGDACVERFNGQFAFALWDPARRRLVLARDRVGIRPLYYTLTSSNTLLFSSEIKGLLQSPEVCGSLDPEGLAQVFTFWAPVAPRTVIRGVRQVRPGSLLVLEDGSVTERSYWQPRFLPADRPFQFADQRRTAELAEELRGALEQATRLRMLRSDVPVGVYLSGGIDSSVIGALVRRFHQGPLSTFSVRFAQRDFDEGGFQELMVRRLGTDHASVEVDQADIARAFPEVIWHAEAPLLRTAPAPLFRLSGLVRSRGYKVVLTGEGADEILAGYDLFREDKVRRFWARRPDSALRPLLLQRLYPWMSRAPAQARTLQQSFFGKGMDRLGQPHFSHIPRWEATAALQRLFSPALRESLKEVDVVSDLLGSLPAEVAGLEPLGKAQYLELLTLLSGYLLSSQGDRMLMGHSVEGRFPFLDHNVMELCNRMPPEVKLRGLDEKHALKLAARDLIPEEILRRPKQPYRSPDARCFTGPDTPEYLEEVLGEPMLRDAGVFSPAAVGKLLQKCRAYGDRTPSNSDNMALVGVVSTQLMHKLFVRGQVPRVAEERRPGTWIQG